jgi:hypothetical protein
VAVALLARDPGQVFEVARTQAPTTKVRWADEEHLIVREGLARELGRRRQATHDAELELMRSDELEGAPGGRQAEVDLHQGVVAGEVGQRPGQQVRPRDA